ncbi:MAG: cytochrome c biogenesis protein ResB [Oceanipulchritudo sp.]
MKVGVYGFLSSIHLTLFLLTAGVLLILFGTLDQVQYGIYFTQQKYFEHVFVVWNYPQQWLWGEKLDWLQIPLPGGYLIGPLLVINLACAHFRYFRPSWKKAGIPLIHAGIILLLLGQLWTQLQQKEYFLWLGEGESKNYVESFHYDEFVLVEIAEGDTRRVHSWETRDLNELGKVLHNDGLPFSIEVLWFARNAAIFPRPPMQPESFPEMPFNRGIGAERDLVVLPQRPTFAEGERNATSAIVRLKDGETEIGTWLVSNLFRSDPPMREHFPIQSFEHGGRQWQLALRFKRMYLPAQIELADFRHDRYPGTEIPYNFSSTVRIREPGTKGRETLIYMNHPLRYAGLTFYQASFADNDTKSMFQVVHNPARWVPYVACALTTLGLVVQFLVSLFVHGRKRRAPGAAAGPEPSSRGPEGPTPRRGRAFQAAILSALILGAGLLLLRHLQPPGYPAGWDLDRFARLPVQEGGRIKPIDTVARTTLMMISGKQSYSEAGGKRVNAPEWFAELVLDPRTAARRAVFRIDHPDLVGLLGFHNEERKYFSMEEIAPHFESLQEQFRQLPEEPRLWNPFQKALGKLRGSLALYDRSASILVPPPFFGNARETYTMLERVREDAASPEEGENAANALNLFRAQFARLAATAHVQAVPPLPGHGAGGWQSLGDSLLATVDSGSLDPVPAAWADLSSAWQEKDSVRFKYSLERLENLYRNRTGERAEKTGFEYFFNTFTPFGAAMELYILILIAAAFSWMGWTRVLARAAFWILVVAFAVHTFGLGARIYIQERPPVTNLYSSAIFVSWAAIPICLYLERRYLNGIAAAAAAVMGFTTLIIAHHLSFSGDTMEMMRAVLDSNFWLATHVPTVTIGYSATFLAGLLGAIHILRWNLPGGIDPQTGKAISGMVYGAVCFALLFSYVGTVLGGIWADQSWGRFWGWDPKENGALMIVLWNAIILHARWAKVAGTTGLMQLAVAGNIITAWSWFGTNMLGVGLHSYGFMDAAFLWLVAFIASQVAIILLGYRRRHP